MKEFKEGASDEIDDVNTVFVYSSGSLKDCFHKSRHDHPILIILIWQVSCDKESIVLVSI